MFISVEESSNSQQEPGQESVGDAAVLSHCSLLRNTWPKPTGVLEQFSALFLLTAFLRLRKMSMYRNSPHTGIPVDYTSKFRELFETTKGMDSGWK
jgi:hypothetical protein